MYLIFLLSHIPSPITHTFLTSHIHFSPCTHGFSLYTHFSPHTYTFSSESHTHIYSLFIYLTPFSPQTCLSLLTQYLLSSHTFLTSHNIFLFSHTHHLSLLIQYLLSSHTYLPHPTHIPFSSHTIPFKNQIQKSKAHIFHLLISFTLVHFILFHSLVFFTCNQFSLFFCN